MIMGCYGIGIGRTVAASIEQNHDNAGIIWPDALAPFDVSIILTNPSDQTLLDVATRLYTQLSQRYDVLFDNRVESAGVKFKDHDLIGIPTQIIIGKKWTSDQKIEIKRRRNRDVTWLDVDGVDEFLSRL